MPLGHWGGGQPSGEGFTFLRGEPLLLPSSSSGCRAGCWAGIPLGGLIAGAAVTDVGLVPVLLACGAAYFITTNLAGLRSEWREMDRTRGRGALKSLAKEDASQGSANVGAHALCTHR